MALQPPEHLPPRVQAILRDGPFTGRSGSNVIVYDQSGTVQFIWVEVEFPDLKGKKIQDFLSPYPDDGDMPEPRFFDLTETTTFRVSVDVRIIGAPWRTNEFLDQYKAFPGILTVSPVEGYYVALLHVLYYFLSRAKGLMTEDMMVTLGKNEEITNVCDNFNAYIGRNPKTDRRMDQLTEGDAWLKLLRREEGVLRYLRDVAGKPAAGWQKTVRFDRLRPEEWVVHPGSLWNIDGGVLRSATSPLCSFITYRDSLDQAKNDFLVRFDAELSACLKEDFIVGVTFHVKLDETLADRRSPDTEGYSLSLRRISGTGDAVRLTLKKFTNAISEIIVPLEDILRRNGMDPARIRLGFEKTGGAFSCSMDGEKIGTLYDTAPLHSPENQRLGFLATDKLSISNIEISSRPTLINLHEIPPETVDLRFHKFPGHIFETRMVKARFGTPRDIRAAYFKDVTYSRGLLDKLNMNLRLIEEDLDMAKKIETLLADISLPSHPGIELSFCHRSSGKVGGDLLDIKDLGQGRFAVLIYDVSGHGIAASLVACMTKVSFENAFKQTLSPAEIMERVNHDICIVSDASMFVTAFLCIIDLKRSVLTCARAGHCPPALFSKDRPDGPLVLTEGSPILGNRLDIEFKEYETSFRKGDRLLLYTDGISELRNRGEEFFGVPRLYSVIQNNLDKTVDETKRLLLKEAEAFAGGRPFVDDLTFILADIK